MAIDRLDTPVLPYSPGFSGAIQRIRDDREVVQVNVAGDCLVANRRQPGGKVKVLHQALVLRFQADPVLLPVTRGEQVDVQVAQTFPNPDSQFGVLAAFQIQHQGRARQGGVQGDGNLPQEGAVFAGAAFSVHVGYQVASPVIDHLCDSALEGQQGPSGCTGLEIAVEHRARGRTGVRIRRSNGNIVQVENQGRLDFAHHVLEGRPERKGPLAAVGRFPQAAGIEIGKAAAHLAKLKMAV